MGNLMVMLGPCYEAQFQAFYISNFGGFQANFLPFPTQVFSLEGFQQGFLNVILLASVYFHIKLGEIEAASLEEPASF